MLFTKCQVFAGKENNVWKYVFESDNAVVEAVLYRYEDFYKRTVICCSVMSGCPVGCTFCGTGKQYIRPLSHGEIVEQIQRILKDKDIQDINYRGERFQIMFMSMGEPMLNWDSVKRAINELNTLYPRAELLISTIGVNNIGVFHNIIETSQDIDKIGLQFSIHASNDDKRNTIIPFANKMDLRQIRDYGMMWAERTKRFVYLNYCITQDNTTPSDIARLKDLFSPIYFKFTFSVICDSTQDDNNKNSFRDLNYIQNVADSFIGDGYNVRVFNPAGQDDIGGGCGQLWYVQQWMKERKCGMK